MRLENHSSLGSPSFSSGGVNSQLPPIVWGYCPLASGRGGWDKWPGSPGPLPLALCFVTLTRSYLFLFFPFSLSSAVCVFKSKMQQLALCPLSSSFSFFHYALFFFLIYSCLSVSCGILMPDIVLVICTGVIITLNKLCLH